MKKRTFSLLMVMVMLLSTIPSTAFASSADAIIKTAAAAEKRYTVLMLDHSGSMQGTPLNAMKRAAAKFCETLLKTDGENYIAIAAYDSTAIVYSNFTSDYASLQTAINRISNDDGDTNTNEALVLADDLLVSLPDDPEIVKNILLLSDGLPNTGSTAASGRYTNIDYGYYTYANAAYNTAASLMSKGYNIYSLGFFHDLLASDLPFARRFMGDIQNSGYYDVVNPDDLDVVFGDIADDMVKEKTGSFQYSAKNSYDQDYAAPYTYKDDYFSGNASAYHTSLATLSLCFAMSAGGSNISGTVDSVTEKNVTDYSNKARNARNFLEQIGFKPGDIETNHYFTVKPSEDSMGVIAAHKDIKVNGQSYTLIALACRGGGYEAEWAGNFTVGATGHHAGFKTASDEAHRFLTDYINRHKAQFQPNIKLWFTGYSRAAAAVNLLAGRLDDEKRIAGITVNKENLFAYCFEVPMGAAKSRVTPTANYTNIHNIVNPSDIVPKVAPRDLGFARYGTDEPVIPSALSSANAADFAAMLARFKALDTDGVKESIVTVNGKEKHIIDTFQAKKFAPSVTVDLGHWEQKTGLFGIKYWVWVPNFKVDVRLVANDNKTMSLFLDELILAISVGVGNRANYTAKLQQAMRLAAAEFMGGGYETYKWNLVPEIFDKKLKSHTLDIASALVWTGVSAAEELVMKYLFDSISEAGISISAYGSVPAALAEALRVVVRTIVASASLNGGNDLLTLVSEDNISKLFPAHYPELCLAWMQSQDENYNGTAKYYINGYRVLRVNCPVDISVYDSRGSLVAQIIDDVPQELSDSMIVASFNANGEKVIYLPADEDYDVKISAAEDGELNYSVSEFSYDTGTYAKIVNYYDVPIVTGEVLEGVVPKFQDADADTTADGSDVKYALSDVAGELLPSKELVGEAAQDAVYAVYAESNNENGGTTMGGGAYSEGAFAQVSAVTFENCEFEGWYENDVLMSTDSTYRFRVDRNVTLSAEFSGSRPTPESGTYELAITAATGGSITIGADGNYSPGSVTPLEATPNSGYRFKNWTSSNGGSFANPSGAATTFTMPSGAAIITANFEPADSANSGNNSNNGVSNGGGGGGGSGSRVTSSPLQTTMSALTTSALTVPALATAEPWVNPFADVNAADWFYSDVEFSYVKGLMQGTSANPPLFSPNTPMTRGMLVTVLYRLAGEPDVSIGSFSDVSDSAFYGKAVAWAAANGIVTGVGDNMFAPERYVTRQDLAAIIYRYQEFSKQIPPDIVADREFSDWASIADYAKSAVNRLTMQGVLRGKPGNLFDPEGNATRAEVSAIWRRFAA